MPAHMDGRPLVEALREDAPLPSPQIGEAWGSRDATQTMMSDEEEQIIRQKLRDLGYVG